MEQLQSYYQDRKSTFETELTSVNAKLKTVTFIRVISFVASFVLLYVLFEDGWMAAVGFVAPMLVLGFFVRKSTRLNEQKLLIQNLIAIQDTELRAIKGDYSKGDTGLTHAITHHPFSGDLGVFGTGSLFQLLSRTVTKGGAKELANQLSTLELSKEEIDLRQKSIQELATKTEWQHQFRANYRTTDKEATIEFPSVEVFPNRLLKVLYYILPLGMLGLLVALMLDMIPFSYVLYASFIPLTFTGVFLKKTTLVAQNAEELLKEISAYTHYIYLIENEIFTESLNVQNQSQLKGAIKASVALKKLQKILNGFDNRNNIVLGVVLNAFLLWDIKHLKQFMEWNHSYGGQLSDWLVAVSAFDARISAANYVYNNSENTFPIILNQADFYYKADRLSHPLLKPAVRVPNSIVIDGWNQIDIITGANMAGKSTFLRTIGSSMILGTLGISLPGSLTFTPVKLFSSMKTEDSLNDNESYFFAELKRLKQLVDLLESGQPTFAILDEILKGTNSRDKATGSAEFLKKLLRYPLSGIIATHDLSLCELNSFYPNNIANYAFEVDMNGDDLHFDYTLKQGVCQNMNATFLLKKMNLID
jgi:hypothetical protein